MHPFPRDKTRPYINITRHRPSSLNPQSKRCPPPEHPYLPPAAYRGADSRWVHDRCSLVDNPPYSSMYPGGFSIHHQKTRQTRTNARTPTGMS